MNDLTPTVGGCAAVARRAFVGLDGMDKLLPPAVLGLLALCLLASGCEDSGPAATGVPMTGDPTDGSEGTADGSEGTADGSEGTTDGSVGKTDPTDGMSGTTGCDDPDNPECGVFPATPLLVLNLSRTKRFDFSWRTVEGADYYQLEERVRSGEPFLPIDDDITEDSVSHEMPLHLRWEASYRILACNASGCTPSDAVDVLPTLVDAVGYVKAPNTDAGDRFGDSVALSADGDTLAVGATGEDSGATGIGGDQADNLALRSGAVYVLVRDATGSWSQQAYIKSSAVGIGDEFGSSVALSANGDTLAIGARWEDSGATGIDGNSTDDGAEDAGAVYVLVRDAAGHWAHEAYVKASNTQASDEFGSSVALSAEGDTLAVAARAEDGSAAGIDGYQDSNSMTNAGAVYVFARDAADAWFQQAYVKASNPDAGDNFGASLALAADGDTLAVSANFEDSAATGIGGDASNDSMEESGAVYVFVRGGGGSWSQQAYVKASNTDAGDRFGYSVALSAGGETLAVGALWESSSATGVGGSQADNLASNAGAAYVFIRDATNSWSQQSYLKAFNVDVGDAFGTSVALSANGDTLAVGARFESSNEPGLGGDGVENSALAAGAAYVFTRDVGDSWSQRAFVKASNPDAHDQFGSRLALSGDGDTLAVGTGLEAGGGTGLDGDRSDNSALSAGAIYLF